jgi:hypothetical protein
MVVYFTGIWLEDDGDGNYTKHDVLWAKYSQSHDWPEEWILMEIDGKEEHQCDSAIWAQAENDLDIECLRLSID